MNISIVKQSDLASSQWGHGAGTMCEVYRYPKNADNHSYLVRFSTATIEIPESNFTLYPGYIRHHRTLQGACEFAVDTLGDHTLTNQSGSVFDFFGETQVKCKLATTSAFAINLIHQPQVQVTDRVMQVRAASMNLDQLLQTPFSVPASAALCLHIVYIIEGTLSVQATGCDQQHHLTAGDAIIVTRSTTDAHRAQWAVTSGNAKIYHGLVGLEKS